jgi:hypothetical protein
MENLDLEYWQNYHDQLELFISEWKQKLDYKESKNNFEKIQFNYDVEFYNESVARLVGEIDRVKNLISVLKYTYETGEIQKLD